MSEEIHMIALKKKNVSQGAPRNFFSEQHGTVLNLVSFFPSLINVFSNDNESTTHYEDFVRFKSNWLIGQNYSKCSFFTNDNNPTSSGLPICP
jgi:hypothetical protein